METHIMHKFEEDFYEQNLKLVITEYIRPMLDFKSLEELISAIDNDIKQSHESLNKELYDQYSSHTFFSGESIIPSSWSHHTAYLGMEKI